MSSTAADDAAAAERGEAGSLHPAPQVQWAMDSPNQPQHGTEASGARTIPISKDHHVMKDGSPPQTIERETLIPISGGPSRLGDAPTFYESSFTNLPRGFRKPPRKDNMTFRPAPRGAKPGAQINSTGCERMKRVKEITGEGNITVQYLPASWVSQSIRRWGWLPQKEPYPAKLLDVNSRDAQNFVMVGKFYRGDSVPKERLLILSRPVNLFSHLFWTITKLRGLEAFLSLKDVKRFGLYEVFPLLGSSLNLVDTKQCYPISSTHKRIKLTDHEEQILIQLTKAYKSWQRHDNMNEKWMEWIHTNLNDSCNKTMTPYSPFRFPEERSPTSHLSLEIILGWSAIRISLVVLIPVILSLIIGIWFQSRNWTDLTTIQTAWTIASYIVTSGGRESF